MTNVSKLPVRPTMRRGDYAIMTQLNWSNLLQAWTLHDLDEVLDEERHPDFLRSMYQNCAVGDLIEMFQVTDLEHPERDPLSMASLIVTSFSEQRDGLHMHVRQTMPLLRFGPGGDGITASRWNGMSCVWRDGARVGVFGTDVEARECADRLRRDAGLPPLPRVRNRSARETVSKERCRREDIAPSAARKISPVITCRTLLPIEQILGNPRYFARVSQMFGPASRLNIMRFSNDGYGADGGAIVELVHNVLVDVSDGEVRLFPSSPIMETGSAPDVGYILHHGVKGRVLLRRDGRVVEIFKRAQDAQFWLEERGIEAAKAA